ncbi:MAG: nucleotidyl transferase AbiEii/AbiGii toxin family protein [Myxococcaceae bacterium]|nr:nucleotidyl transferase AbiEii/AbiGii toxin family protein [Myxococcaceae bacterium]
MVRVQTEVMVGLVFDGVDIDLVRYPYPLLTPPTPGPGGFPRAGVMDLAVMKLAAIGRRGLRRDFWDLFVLLEGGGLTIEQVVKAYRKRYRTSASDGYHLIRALAYFEDAERDDPRVIGLTPARWQTIRSFFEAESARLLGR